MIYINSEGEGIETATMDKNHLVNALIKSAKEVILTAGDIKIKTKANLDSLKQEILIRLK